MKTKSLSRLPVRCLAIVFVVLLSAHLSYAQVSTSSGDAFTFIDQSENGFSFTTTGDGIYQGKNFYAQQVREEAALYLAQENPLPTLLLAEAVENIRSRIEYKHGSKIAHTISEREIIRKLFESIGVEK